MISQRRGLLGEAAERDDWTSRRAANNPGNPYADTAMGSAVVPMPEADPAMANVYQGNLNQAPGIEIGGWLPVNVRRALRVLREGRGR